MFLQVRRNPLAKQSRFKRAATGGMSPKQEQSENLLEDIENIVLHIGTLQNTSKRKCVWKNLAWSLTTGHVTFEAVWCATGCSISSDGGNAVYRNEVCPVCL